MKEEQDNYDLKILVLLRILRGYKNKKHYEN